MFFLMKTRSTYGMVLPMMHHSIVIHTTEQEPPGFLPHGQRKRGYTRDCPNNFVQKRKRDNDIKKTKTKNERTAKKRTVRGMFAEDGGCIGHVVRSLGEKLAAPHMDEERIGKCFAGFKEVKKLLQMARVGVPVAVGKNGGVGTNGGAIRRSL